MESLIFQLFTSNFNRTLSQYIKDFHNQPGTAKLDLINADIQEYFLTLAETDLARLNSQYLVAISRAEHERNQIIAWFNNEGIFDSLPSA